MRSISDADFTITEADINEAVVGIGNYIEEMYPNGCTIVGILAGALPTMLKLTERFALSSKSHLYRVTFIGARSYEGEDKKEKIGVYGVPSEHLLRKRNVMLVDDVLDTGSTLRTIGRFIMDKFKSNHVRVAALCVKGDLPEWIDAAAVGFQVPKTAFIVGFGMDYKNKFRELAEIRPLRDEERAEKGITEQVEVPRTDAQEEAGVAAS